MRKIVKVKVRHEGMDSSENIHRAKLKYPTAWVEADIEHGQGDYLVLPMLGYIPTGEAIIELSNGRLFPVESVLVSNITTSKNKSQQAGNIQKN